MTISFNNIGNLGHLGNQMFQYAATKGVAYKNNTNFFIAPKEYFGNRYKVVSVLDDCFDLKCERSISNFPIYNEQSFSYNKNLDNVEDNIDLLGYFQSEKYFKEVEDEIKEDFQFKSEIYDPSKEQFENMFDNSNVISLHIRRGDYLVNSNHPIQPLSYYEKALSYFSEDTPVLIFSDDPEWCSEQELFDSDRYMISYTKNQYVDLCLMTFCDFHIIANSSFSWWGSWLSNSKKTVAPKKWFSGNCINHNTEDLYCSDWIKV